MFAPSRPVSGGADADATLCEVHGALQSAPAYADLARGTLPTLGASCGFGFEAPPPSAPAPATTAGAPTGSNKRQRLTGGEGAAALAASRLWSSVGLPPPPPNASDDSAAPSMLSPTRLIAFSWQPHGLQHPLEPSSRGVPSPSAVAHLMCACALAPEDTIALYDLYEQQWASQRLSHPQQKRVASVAWQPQAASVLAVGCVKGVCLWRLAFTGSTGALTGGAPQRRVRHPYARAQ